MNARAYLLIVAAVIVIILTVRLITRKHKFANLWRSDDDLRTAVSAGKSATWETDGDPEQKERIYRIRDIIQDGWVSGCLSSVVISPDPTEIVEIDVGDTVKMDDGTIVLRNCRVVSNETNSD